MKMKKIAALTLAASCLAFTLPSVAANYTSPIKSHSVAYQQKSDVNESIEQLKNGQDDLRDQINKLNANLYVIEDELASQNMLHKRVDEINDQLNNIFHNQLNINWNDV